MFEIGKLAPDSKCSRNEIDVDFERLTQKLKDEGLFRTNYWFYAEKLAIYAVLLLAIVSAVIYSNSFIVHMIAAVALGMFWQQVIIAIFNKNITQ